MINRLPEHWTSRAHAERQLTHTERSDIWRQKSSRGWVSEIEQGLGRYPLATVLAGLALGVLLGWCIKR